MSKSTIKSKRGRPISSDPRVSCHVPLSASERTACNLAARLDGLAFAPWARQTLLARVRATPRTASEST
jgi:hypothetical protein